MQPVDPSFGTMLPGDVRVATADRWNGRRLTCAFLRVHSDRASSST